MYCLAGETIVPHHLINFLQTGEHLLPPDIDERVDTCKEHLLAVMDWKGASKGIGEMRKHYSTYFRAFKPLRIELLQAKELDHILDLFERIRVFGRN